ncbi:MAG: GNAT family N-acetyltransferase [Ruminococcaceae bacterium]|nr:GNAT family N-acetyltransferase [Oscillospiraceae bacterium]
MIEYLDINAFNPQIALFGNDAVACEILSEISTWGKESHKYSAFFWHQDNSLFLSMRNNHLRIAGEIKDREELLSFIKFISPRYILLSENLFNEIVGDAFEKGEILICPKEGEVKTVTNDPEVSLFELADFFKKENMIENEESFISDAAFALSKNLCAFEAIKMDGKIISAAFSNKITPLSAVINIVATAKDYRGKGFGFKVTQSLKNKLSGRNLFVFKEKDKNNGFYNKLSFKYSDNFITIKEY